MTDNIDPRLTAQAESSEAPVADGFASEAVASPSSATGSESPRVRKILDEARAMLRESGWNAVSMRRLAARLGVKAPSLYKHISGKDELFRFLLDEMLTSLADALHEAYAAEPTARSVLAAYREYALADRNGYRLIFRSKAVDITNPDELDMRIREPFTQVTHNPVAGLAMWAFAHGLINAELVQDKDVDVDGIWAAGAAAFQAAADAEIASAGE